MDFKVSLEMIKNSVLATRLNDDSLRYYIDNSSYAKKHELPNLAEATRKELETAYVACRDYACNSLVDSLITFDDAKNGQVKELNCDKDHFFLLARVRTNWENRTIEETAEARRYMGFTILTEKNLSHFPGRVLYGYRSGVDASMIAHIYPCDSNTDRYETDPLKLTDTPEILLAAEDLRKEALRLKAYSQVTIETKTAKQPKGIKKGTTLTPDAVIAIDEISPDDKLAAKERRLPIVLIHKGQQTVMRVFDAHERAELANPALI